MVRIFRHYIPTAFVLLGVIETLVLVLSVYLGSWLRFLGSEVTLAFDGLSLGKALLFAVLMLSSMTFMGLYQRHLREGVAAALLRVGAGLVIGLVLLSILFYVIPEIALGRGEFALSFLVALSAVVLIRFVFVRFVDDDTGNRRILVLGVGNRAMAINNLLRRKTDQRGFSIVGYVKFPGDRALVEDNVIQHDVTLLELAIKYQIDEIVVAIEDRRKSFPMHEIVDCRMSGVDVVDLLTFFERQTGKVMIDILNPSWLVFSDGFKYGVLRVYSKRLFDIVASLLLLLISLPAIIATVIAIYLEDRGPVLYRQVRVGENWKLFQVLKFRSMRVDAESDGQAKFASKDDTRITRVGDVIRKLRVDELPQIINVLRGDMSFVGPRPERPVFVEQLSENIDYYSERHRVKPGITGWAQICYPYGDSEKDSYEKLQFDLYYVKNYSLFLDLIILFQTAGAVLWGKGGR
ncbi:MAG: TIGR03013 family PEP-CTERM/XrtA system glycosyltransferase [Chromatiales bacterium]|nr:TIGR03013 family PEP-CTERM/XrtA system glycosyltransferase [Chromatiales bacterium]